MQKFLIFALFVVVLSAGTIQLNASPEIDLLYSFPDSETIQFTLQFSTQGYVGIGFGNSMTTAQIYLAYKDATGKFVLVSAHASTHTVPTPDAHQNFNLVSADRDSEKTVVVFNRKLNTGDPQDSVIQLNTPTDLIWSYGASDELVHHVARGYQQVTFSTAGKEFLSSQ